ncbi:MAG: hypothetical protein ACLTAZ_08460 [Dysosmobacter welbionis]|uniref:hypothetical protein n=1 Tax=Dysosmobacter welbionis TaxID=2093857 RepID=UPI003993B1C1
MDQYEFQRELDEVLPSPDPQMAERLSAFVEENEIVSFEDYLASLRFVVKNFGRDTLESIPKMIDDKTMILPDEMAAAAICVQGGVPVDQVQQMAYEGWLMGFFDARVVDNGGLSPLAVCSIVEHGREEKFCTAYFGSFSPGNALHCAVEYAGQHDTTTAYALKNLTADLRVGVDAPSGRKILDQRRPSLLRAMERAFAQCPAVAAKVTFDTDQREVTVDYNPLWLERQKMTGPRMGGMEGGMKR